MSLRLRLALWYGGLTGLVVLLVSLFTYAAHTRGHYDDMDYTLLTTAQHTVQEYETGTRALPGAAQGTGGQVEPSTSISFTLAVWVYDAQDRLVDRSPSANEAPSIDPIETLAHPAGPPFDAVAALASSLAESDAGRGAFGMAAAPDGSRWRYYVLPFSASTHFLVVGDSLARVDASVAQFRLLVVLLTLAAGVITLLAGWLLASRALRPVAVLTDTAGAIAHSRGFGERVPEPTGGRQDELGRLAATFNDMLASLEQAYRAQQRFVSDASHELRAPLTAIQGNLELLERMPNLPPEERQEAIREASREAHRLSRLVADLLALARADSGVTMRQEPVELDRVLLEAVSEARHLTHGQGLQVEEIEPALVRGDRDRLKQLFLIILDNAVKYTPPSGKVSVSLGRREGQVRAEIRDTGIGIPAEEIPRVFDRFYRADPARGRDPGGTGLGLAIARWIVEQHHGTITLESRQGEGTVVVVALPVAQGLGARG